MRSNDSPLPPESKRRKLDIPASTQTALVSQLSPVLLKQPQAVSQHNAQTTSMPNLAIPQTPTPTPSVSTLGKPAQPITQPGAQPVVKKPYRPRSSVPTSQILLQQLKSSRTAIPVPPQQPSPASQPSTQAPYLTLLSSLHSDLTELLEKVEANRQEIHSIAQTIITQQKQIDRIVNALKTRGAL